MLPLSETFIPDGYTRSGYIAGVDRLHGALEFEYRPMRSDTVNQIRKALAKFSEEPVKSATAMRASMAQHVVSWDAKNPKDGSDVKCTIDAIRCLQPALADKLYFVLAGIDASDPKPNATDSETEDWAEQVIREASGGETQETVDAKNSLAG